LGHITTFGGHPVCCAAGMESFKILTEEGIIGDMNGKCALFLKHLVHPLIISVHSFGLWIAVEFDSFDTCRKVIGHCINNGVLTDWFLFASNSLRISPPLTISREQINHACNVILNAINSL
jgi:acetylornithine/succinyldiaminopimelate/putrescine aminotransferase